MLRRHLKNYLSIPGISVNLFLHLQHTSFKNLWQCDFSIIFTESYLQIANWYIYLTNLYHSHILDFEFPVHYLGSLYLVYSSKVMNKVKVSGRQKIQKDRETDQKLKCPWCVILHGVKDKFMHDIYDTWVLCCKLRLIVYHCTKYLKRFVKLKILT